MFYILALSLLLTLVVMMLRRTQMPSQLRSVVAVMFGFFAMALTISLCTMAAVLAMHPISGKPTPGTLAASAGCSVLAALLGGWVAGDIAPAGQQLWHGVALAVVMVALSLIAILHPTTSQPMWHRLFLTFVAPLAAVLGAALAPRRLRI